MTVLAVCALAVLFASATFFLPHSTRITFDPRLKNTLIAMGGPQEKIRPKDPFMGSFIRLPHIILGLDTPPEDYNRAALHRVYFHAIASVQSTLTTFAPTDKNTIITNDPIAFTHMTQRFSRVEFVNDAKSIKKRLLADPHAIGILPFGPLGPQYKSLSSSFPLHYWLGWKEADKLGWTGINAQMMTTVENLISHSQREYQVRLNSFIIPGIIRVLSHRLPNMEGVRNKIKGPNVVIANVAGALDENSAAALKATGFNLINLANDQSIAPGSRALEDTLLSLKNAGLPYVGAGFNHEEAKRPFFITFADDTTAGVAAYSEHIPVGSLPAFNKSGINSFLPAKMQKDLAGMKTKADIRVVIIHWRDRPARDSSQHRKRVAHQALEWGCDLFIGLDSKGEKKGEWIKDKVIAYNLGNFEDGVTLSASYNFSKLFSLETGVSGYFLESADHPGRVLGSKNRIPRH